MQKTAKIQKKSVVQEPKQIISELRIAELEALFLSIGEGVIVTDEHGKISRINDCALKILGFTAEEVIGKWYPDTVIAEEESGVPIPNLERPITEVFISGRPVFKRVYYRKKDGTKAAVALTVSPVLLDEKPIGAIEVFRDITDEIKLEKAKDEFIALASHQLRTPATSVKQYAGMLLGEFAGKLTDVQIDLVQRVYDSNERQIAIINDLLRVAQIDAGRMQLALADTPIDQMLKDIAADQNSKFIERNQTLELSCPKKAVFAAVDPPRFRMALENIIDNASKYSSEGKKILITLNETKKYTEIQVIDEGVGIAADEIFSIFEKFTRLDNPLSIAVGGTGLGLYWVKKVLDLHGAILDVSSIIGKGTIFKIQLPKT